MVKKAIKFFSVFYKYVLIYLYYLKKISFKKNEETKTIIIFFDGLFSHGGIVDRFKGIISFYEISKLLGYNFQINFVHPFPLEYFLKPNKINWKIQKNKKFNPFSTKIIYLMNDFKTNPFDLIESSQAKVFLVYCNVNYLSKLYPNLSEEEISVKWQSNYNELFSISSVLKKEIEGFPKNNNIIIHTRFMSLMGDFKDTTNHVLDDESKILLSIKLLNRIDKIAKNNSNKNVIVLSDSLFFLNYVKKNSIYKTSGGVPKHIDFSNDLDSFLKTFKDFYLMSKCDEVFLVVLDKMYTSGFSEFAAKIGNVKFTIIKE